MANPAHHDKFWAGGFLYDRKKHAVFLHHRDNNTRINPDKWAFFGGLNEGPETYEECFARELKEEIGLDVTENQVVPLREYLNTDLKTYRVVFYVETDIAEEHLRLGEGAGFGWVLLSELNKYDLTDKTKEDIDFFVSTIGDILS